MARKYEKVKALLPAVEQLQAEGKTRKEIAKELGLQSERTVKDLLYRARHKQEKAIPKQRGRKPAKTLAEYKYENKRLKMENKLLRDFLQSISEAQTQIPGNIPASSRIFSIRHVQILWCIPQRLL